MYKESSLEYITDISADEMLDDKITELTLYFARQNESVWDIAKAFQPTQTYYGRKRINIGYY